MRGYYNNCYSKSCDLKPWRQYDTKIETCVYPRESLIWPTWDSWADKMLESLRVG